MFGSFTSRRAVPAEIVEVPPPPGGPLPEETASPALAVTEPPADTLTHASPLLSEKLLDAKVRLHRRLIEELNLSVLEKMPDDEVRRHVHGLVAQYTLAERLALNAQELEDFVACFRNRHTTRKIGNVCAKTGFALFDNNRVFHNEILFQTSLFENGVKRANGNVNVGFARNRYGATFSSMFELAMAAPGRH